MITKSEIIKITSIFKISQHLQTEFNILCFMNVQFQTVNRSGTHSDGCKVVKSQSLRISLICICLYSRSVATLNSSTVCYGKLNFNVKWHDV